MLILRGSMLRRLVVVRNIGSIIVAAAMVLPTIAFAQTEVAQSPASQVSGQAPVQPGGAAGIEQAQGIDLTTAGVGIGAGFLAGSLCVVMCGSGHNTTTTTTTTTTTGR